MKIAAFNVKRLGWNKVNKKEVRDIIIKIVSQYSVVLLEEVVDVSAVAMGLLLKHLNDYGDNKSNPYGMLCSESLGPNRYKEKFVYFYRSETQKLVLIPVHTKPSNAKAELKALHDVVKDVKKRWQNDNIMILGDFNADGKYLSNEQKETLRIFSAPYHWLIGDEVKTTTCNNNDYTYDRIVVYGERMLEAIVPNSAKAYNFEEELNLTDEQDGRVFIWTCDDPAGNTWTAKLLHKFNDVVWHVSWSITGNILAVSGGDNKYEFEVFFGFQRHSPMGVFIPGVSAEPLTSLLSTDTEQTLLLGHYLDVTQQKAQVAQRIDDVISLCCELSAHDRIKLGVKTSLDGGLMLAGMGVVGGLLFGPIGLLVGGTAGGLLGYLQTKDQFQPLPQILMELTPAQKMGLYSDIKLALGSISWMDAAELISLVMDNYPLKQKIIEVLQNVTKELRLKV
ncbi:Deoxyribonuclease-1-like 1 [Dissostichus eleginoides]|uniref:Deoxyribonuclease-1-like 1 n=1 Tax=Dissostichus eleginoides TaxID=100907 RepID=A0AAD9FFS2_DISEL|nr:Deoxyribonuclease-1-like 1 [Dissostichus eleginoides]